jgi:hypothetical protein
LDTAPNKPEGTAVKIKSTFFSLCVAACVLMPASASASASQCPKPFVSAHASQTQAAAGENVTVFYEGCAQPDSSAEMTIVLLSDGAETVLRNSRPLADSDGSFTGTETVRADRPGTIVLTVSAQTASGAVSDHAFVQVASSVSVEGVDSDSEPQPHMIGRPAKKSQLTANMRTVRRPRTVTVIVEVSAREVSARSVLVCLRIPAGLRYLRSAQRVNLSRSGACVALRNIASSQTRAAKVTFAAGRRARLRVYAEVRSDNGQTVYVSARNPRR